MSRRRAIAIARDRAGGGRVDDVDRDDDDDGPAVWKVKLARAGGIEREVHVRIADGRVVKVQSDRDDADDRGGDRDDDGADDD